mmetsp:Transcript_22752/g.75462  ORF Transcript_22752/g.75462 Transcript_22752/m.75462 type:complete len:1094 (-) Transcript_22752:181-3462(-)
MPRVRDADTEDEPPSQRRRTHTKGTIVRIKLRNFMSYTSAELTADPGKLNCIIGPNGTGKSSIVCAMCVGLGGPIKATERGDAIGGCVHDGVDENGVKPTEGSVETELFEGSGAGRNLIVRLDFNTDNKEKWFMDGEPSSKKKVKEKMASMNIQVDNPLQFLPQDKVGAFSNMSPVALLKETERAIGPDVCAQHEQLVVADKELKSMKQSAAGEEKSLVELEKQNEVLYADVERWNKYQANLKELERCEGKKLWLEYDAERGEYDRRNDEWKSKKADMKEAEAEKKALTDKVLPLKERVASAKRSLASSTESVKKNEAEMAAAVERSEKEDDAAEEAKAGLHKVDKALKKLTDTVGELERRIEGDEEELRVEEQKVNVAYGGDVAAAKKAAADEVRSARQELEAREDDLANYELGEHEGRVRSIEDQIAGLGDPMRLKQVEAAKMNSAVPHVGKWVYEQVGGGSKEAAEAKVLGPMLLYLDLPDKGHQKLAVQAFPARTLTSFLARDEGTRDQLQDELKRRGPQTRITVFRNRAKTFSPSPNRPPSADMKRFGVTAWLDEALRIRDDLRGEVLAFLKQQMGVDTYLLATPAAVGKIDALQQYLQQSGMTGVTVLTPERVYRFGRSKYGARAATSSSSLPQRHRHAACFSVVVDTSRKKELEGQLKEARKGLELKRKERQAVERDVGQLQQKLDAAKGRQVELNNNTVRLNRLAARIDQAKKRLDPARESVADFNADAQKEGYRRRLCDAHQRSLDSLQKAAAAVKRHEAALTKLALVRVGLAAAEAQLAEAEGNTDELDERIARLRREAEAAKAEAKKAADKVGALVREAKGKAAEFAGRKEAPLSEEAQGVWDALPAGAEELEDRIAELEAETSSTSADGNSIKEYERRRKEIEQLKTRVDAAQQAIAAQGGKVAGLEQAWRPALEEMVDRVNQKFGSCMAAFRCAGEVSLSDGRSLDEHGEPAGDDDFEKYKIHIKVKWRDGEQLHVLGEAGRDSGGERSVATMVYLISLQEINPAPFRVVDEINQAMDSTNERIIFKCVTEACKDGGKQYFLLTPKLLPDLDYGEDCAIQLVFNGPHNRRRDQFDLSRFC